jgi:hypothetical protein
MQVAMVEVMYFTHLRKGRQRGLAYALHLCKAFSGKLSLLPAGSLHRPQSKGIPIWRAPGWVDHRPVKDGTALVKEQTRKLVVCVKPSSVARESFFKDWIYWHKLLKSDLPLLFIPSDYDYRPLKHFLLLGGGPGMADHWLKHLLAATFLPRAYSLQDQEVKVIHWNNICMLPVAEDGDFPPISPVLLNRHIEQNGIDLITLEGASHYTYRYLQFLFQCACPALVLPLQPQAGGVTNVRPKGLTDGHPLRFA